MTEIHRVIPGSRTGVPGIEAGERLTLDTTESARTVYTVTSGRKFKPTTIICTNFSADARVSIYDDTSDESTRIIELVVGAVKTEVLGPDELIGIREVLSSVVARTSISGLFMHIGGYEY